MGTFEDAKPHKMKLSIDEEKQIETNPFNPNTMVTREAI